MAFNAIQQYLSNNVVVGFIDWRKSEFWGEATDLLHVTDKFIT